MAGKRENVVPFFNGAGVVGKYLADENTSVSVIDADGDFHLFEREHCGIRLLLVARNQNSRVAEKRRRSQ